MTWSVALLHYGQRFLHNGICLGLKLFVTLSRHVSIMMRGDLALGIMNIKCIPYLKYFKKNYFPNLVSVISCLEALEVGFLSCVISFCNAVYIYEELYVDFTLCNNNNKCNTHYAPEKYPLRQYPPGGITPWDNHEIDYHPRTITPWNNTPIWDNNPLDNQPMIITPLRHLSKGPIFTSKTIIIFSDYNYTLGWIPPGW